MTIKQIKEVFDEYSDDMEVQVEFGIDQHSAIEKVDEYHPDGTVGGDENYLLVILA